MRFNLGNLEFCICITYDEQVPRRGSHRPTQSKIDFMPNPQASHPNADVRMRGFVERISVEQALAWLEAELERRPPLTSEIIPLNQAAGRVLAEEVISNVNVPDFRRAMMDGFALQAKDIRSAAAENPVALEVLGNCFPGKPFPQNVGAGQGVRIMTGASLPEGTDTVLPVEKTQTAGDEVLAIQSLPVGKHVGDIGEDVSLGDIVFSPGRTLRPQDIGVLSSIGHSRVSVVRQPKVQIIVTGDELLPAGEQPRGCQIVDANGPMLNALVQRDGGLPAPTGIVPDNRDAILAALETDADIVITTGGSSVGQEDHVPTLLAEHGELAVHGISMRPAGPSGMGTFKNKIVMLLSGNPVACLWGYDLLAGRAVRHLGGRESGWPYQKVSAELSSELTSTLGRLDYVRVQLTNDQATPVTNSGSSVLSSTTRADGFVIIPTDTDNMPAGAKVDVFLFDTPSSTS